MASSSSLGSLDGSKSSHTLSRNPIVDPVECQTQIKDASRRVISMDSVRDGKALLELAREHCQIFFSAPQRREGVRAGSYCHYRHGVHRLCRGCASIRSDGGSISRIFARYYFFVQVQLRNKREETGMDNEMAQCFAARCITELCLCPVYVRRRYSSGGERSLLSCAREELRDSFGGRFLVLHVM